MKLSKDRKKGIIALIVLAFVFASMGLFVRYLKTDFTLLQQTYLRIFAAFLLSLIIFRKDLHFEKITKIPPKEWFIIILRTFSLYLLGVALFSQALIDTKYSNASFISAVPFTAVLGFILLKEKVTLPKVMYILLGFAGVVLIAIKDYAHLFQWGSGEILAFVSSIFFSLSYIARRFQAPLLNNKEIATLMFFIGTILLFGTSLLFHESLPKTHLFSLITVFIILGAGVFNVLNLFLTNYGFQKVDAVLASNLLTLETVFAVILGFLFYQEIPSLKEIIGGCVIVLSVYQLNKYDA